MATVISRVKRIVRQNRTVPTTQENLDEVLKSLREKHSELTEIEAFHTNVAAGWHSRLDYIKSIQALPNNQNEANQKNILMLETLAVDNHRSHSDKAQSISDVLKSITVRIQDIEVYVLKSKLRVDSHPVLTDAYDMRETLQVLFHAEALLELDSRELI